METTDSIAIRPFADSDAQAVRLVAQRDSSIVPAGALLVAEAGGEVRAALSLDTGEVVADPFVATTGLVDLLRARARQLRGRPRRLRGRRVFARGPVCEPTRSPAAI